MRLDGPESQNVDDRRGGGGFGGMGGGSGGGIAVGGIGGILLLLISLFFGVDLSSLTGGGGDPGYAPAPQRQERPYDPRTADPRARDPRTADRAPPSEDGGRRFVGQVLRETEIVWQQQFQRLGRRYEEPVLVLFSGATQSGCGYAQAQTGPFYCPADRKVYIDLDFMAQLQRRLRAGGDFAAAYIIAHEVGHHVQNLLGVLGQVQRRQAGGRGSAESNALQVRVELQADCLAGVWANNAQRQRNILEDGDIEEGLNAAAAVGDDRITQGRMAPESFTHGTSRQRVTWFRRGLESGDLRACDTFQTAG